MKRVICISNEGYKTSLTKDKEYIVLSENKEGMYRIFDDTGEDFLYSKSMFKKAI